MKTEFLNLLGKRVLPIVKDISVSFASSTLHGVNDMHRACHMDYEQTQRMIRRAKAELRKQNKEQQWTVWAVKADGTFDLLSDMGYSQENVSRSDFRLISK